MLNASGNNIPRGAETDASKVIPIFPEDGRIHRGVISSESRYKRDSIGIQNAQRAGLGFLVMRILEGKEQEEQKLSHQ